MDQVGYHQNANLESSSWSHSFVSFAVATANAAYAL